MAASFPQFSDEIDRVRPTAEKAAKALHAHPELSYAEHDSAALLRSTFTDLGFHVSGVDGVETAFVATSGSGPVRVAVCLEYDALPGIGHGCGHHLIAATGILTAAALASAADDLGFTVSAVGCPAEEHGGGKVDLIEAGVFDGVDFAVMVHYVSEEVRANPAGTSSQAVGRYRATFTGKESHAAAAPHLGVNATDAVVVSQVALAMLRQQVPSDHRLSANVVRSGQATNIIPGQAEVEYECRAWTMEEFETLLERIHRCFEAGALATGCEVQIESIEHTFEPLVQDDELAGAWAEHLLQLGIDPEAGTPLGGGSTDMGNVSRRVRSLHPWMPLPGVASPIHSAGFAEGSNQPAAYDLMADVALALAGAVAQVASDQN